MNTDTHGSKKIFFCFDKSRISEGRGISVYQCKSVANSGVLGWVLEKPNINSVFSVVKYFGVRVCGLCGLIFFKKVQKVNWW